MCAITGFTLIRSVGWGVYTAGKQVCGSFNDIVICTAFIICLKLLTKQLRFKVDRT